MEKSSVTVLLVPSLEKVEIKKGKYKIGLKDRSLSDVSEELKKIIGDILSGTQASFQLESMAEVSGIRVDEDDE
ncbi:hypothetical protein FQN60_003551, partial [Etheostoma spectabile]